MSDEMTGLNVDMHAAADAVALVRANLAENDDAAVRILAETGDQTALSAALAYMVTLALRQLPESLMEEYLSEMLRRMRDSALDVERDS